MRGLILLIMILVICLMALLGQDAMKQNSNNSSSLQLTAGKNNDPLPSLAPPRLPISKLCQNRANAICKEEEPCDVVEFKICYGNKFKECIKMFLETPPHT